MPVLGTDNADKEFLAITESGDDNVLLGLAFDFTTTNLQLTDPRDDSGDTKLPPCPVLLCLSLGGKLSLFSVARYVSSLHPKSMEQFIFALNALPVQPENKGHTVACFCALNC
jgi:hypothetical protein